MSVRSFCAVVLSASLAASVTLAQRGAGPSSPAAAMALVGGTLIATAPAARRFATASS